MAKNSKINCFKILGVQHSETVISQFFVSVMQQDKEYLKLFIEQLEIIDKVDYNKCKVVTEHTLSTREKNKKYGRADIWVGSEENDIAKRIIIENKIFAGDQYRQISRYRNYLDEEGANREGYLFYLTLQGKEAPPISSKNKDGKTIPEGCSRQGYKKVSYNYLIYPWLKKIKETSDDKLLNILIEQFLEIFEQLTKSVEFFEAGKSLNEIDSKHKITFKSLCELHFWSELEKVIIQKYPNAQIDSRRKYSYDKIYKNQTDKNFGRSYGIIFNDRRVQLLKENGNYKIKFSKGNFADFDNKWIDEGSETISFDLKKIINKDVGGKVAETIFYHFSNTYNL